MKLQSFSKIKLNRFHLISLVLLASLAVSLTAFSEVGNAQQSLSLADILIALRSKKVTLAERNKLLTDAVKERGITFSLTPEIEKELKTTGADNDLVEAIKQKSIMVKVVATPMPKPVATPVPTPTPPDYTFFQNRGNANFVKGELEMAIVDYNKALELNPKDTSTYLSRALAYYNKQSYDLAVADYGKGIELNPKEAKMYLKRGESYEKLGEIEKALADYNKAVELDANNETAKNSAQRLQTEIDKKIADEKRKEEEKLAAENASKVPQVLELGQLNALAVNLVKPVYPPLAQKMGMQGKVVVQVMLDETGKVINAKAIEGNSALRGVSEYAAKKSTFKPTLANNKPVKATGFITYNFKAN